MRAAPCTPTAPARLEMSSIEPSALYAADEMLCYCLTLVAKHVAHDSGCRFALPRSQDCFFNKKIRKAQNLNLDHEKEKTLPLRALHLPMYGMTAGSSRLRYSKITLCKNPLKQRYEPTCLRVTPPCQNPKRERGDPFFRKVFGNNQNTSICDCKARLLLSSHALTPNGPTSFFLSQPLRGSMGVGTELLRLISCEVKRASRITTVISDLRPV